MKNDRFYVEIEGRIKSINEWTIYYGLKSATVNSRIKYGWPWDKVFLPVCRGLTVQMLLPMDGVKYLGKEPHPNERKEKI